MIKHIVMFKFEDKSKIEKAKELLLSMKKNVPTVQKIEVGVDFLHSARSYDVYLSVEVKDKNALTEYQNDKYHCEIVKTYMHTYAVASVSLDYEI